MLNQKPCPVAPGQGSESARASQAEYLQNSQHRTISQALLSSAIAVSDGREMLGFIVEIDDTAVAVTADGLSIGTYRTRREAFSAISEQHRRT
jgi:hypothetical protein